MIDSTKIIGDYISNADWRVKENANDGYSISGLKGYAVGHVLAEHGLDNAFARDAHIDGSIHIHDLRGGLYSSYCCGHDLRELLMNGLGIGGGTTSKPAKYLGTVIHHMSEYLQIMSNEWEGAQAFSSVDSYLAPFVREEELTQFEVDKAIERLVYSLNFESRQGFQTPFTNLSFDWTVQDDMKDTPCIVGGELLEYTYGDVQYEMDMINIAFLKCLRDGDASGMPFTFPIPTYSVRDESMFIEDDAKTKLLWEVTAKYGSPYFSNYLGSGINPNTIRSMCCRLSLDTEEIAKATSGIWDKGAKTGSLAICTINLNRIGIEANNINEYLTILESRLALATTQLLQRKDYIQHAFRIGLMPYSKKYIGKIDSFFLSFGDCGAWEGYINMGGDPSNLTLYQSFCEQVMTVIKAKCRENANETDWKLWNIEQTPAEGTAYRFARADRSFDPDCYVSGTGDDIYITNSTHLSVDSGFSLSQEINFRAKVDRMYTGGTLFNYYSDEATSPEAVRKLVHRLCKNTALPYVAYTPTFGVCDEHGNSYGSDKCIVCGKDIPVLTRVVGYFRPTTKFNKGQFKQFESRKYHNV